VVLATAESRECVKIFNDKVKELNDPRCNRSVFLYNERYDNIKGKWGKLRYCEIIITH
jgi:hypothetical protein